MDYLSLLVTAALGFQAVIFAVFGVLYSVYAQHMADVSPEDLRVPPIVSTLKKLCRALKNVFWFIFAILLACGALIFFSKPAAIAILVTGLLAGIIVLGWVMTHLVASMGK